MSPGTCYKIAPNNMQRLLIVSYDGFLPEYLNGNNTPNLNKFRDEGTSAEYLLNVFPTKTLVNHFSISTVSMKEFSFYFISY